jgi:uncharacterized cupin superfamily protein
MHVPPGGGLPPHRHDFEEMLTVLDGEVRVTFRGKTLVARAGETINVPANAPHSFTNASDTPSRLLCMRARRTGGVLCLGRPAGHHADRSAAAAQLRSTGRVHREVDHPRPQFKTELLLPGND